MMKHGWVLETFFQDTCDRYSPDRSKPTGEVSPKTGAIHTCRNWARGKILDTLMGSVLDGDCTGCVQYEKQTEKK